MTKEKLGKIAKRYAQDELKDNHGQVEDIVAATFLNGIDYAEHHPHWISVEDELPKDYELVLAVVGGNHFAFVGFCLNQTTWYCDIQNKAVEIKGITHWMSLPLPPNVSTESDKEVTKK